MGWRRGLGRKFGWRRFWKPWSAPQNKISRKEEIEILSKQAEALEEELRKINNRLKELKG
jgi:hypothetical protein